MDCGRAAEIDVEGFLIEPTSVEFEDFRSHYPGCRDCAGEVEGWTAIEVVLRGALAGELAGRFRHPAPERLAAFATDALEAASAEAAEIQDHVRDCATCRTELQLIRRFDASELGGSPATAPLDTAIPEPAAPGLFDAIQRFLESLAAGLAAGSPGRLALPAMAAAMLLGVGLWMAGAFDGAGRRPTPSDGPRLAERSGPAASPPTRPTAPEGATMLEPERAFPDEPAREPAPERLADSRPAAPQAPAPTPSMRPVEPRAPERLADRAPMATAPPPAAPSADSGEASAPREEMLLAALTELPPPRYAAPAGSVPLAWMRQFGAVRSVPSTARAEARAPANHAGQTFSTTPRLWWRVSEDTDLPIQLTLVDDEAIDSLLRVDLAGPHRRGLESLALSDHDVVLEPGVGYRWFVSVIVDPDRPSRNPVSAAALRVVPRADARREQVAAAADSARGHLLAELGVWYDAYDFFASLAEAYPEVESLASHRDRLAELARSTR